MGLDRPKRPTGQGRPLTADEARAWQYFQAAALAEKGVPPYAQGRLTDAQVHSVLFHPRKDGALKAPAVDVTPGEATYEAELHSLTLAAAAIGIPPDAVAKMQEELRSKWKN